jgi:hypothetical protein
VGLKRTKVELYKRMTKQTSCSVKVTEVCVSVLGPEFT